MMLVDVHSHPDFDEYAADIEEYLERQKNAGVKAIVDNGVTAKSNRRVLELARKYDIIRPSLGIYPVWAVDMSEEDFDKELEFISKQKIVAIGEVGLDYLKGDDNPHGEFHKHRMKQCFEQFIKLAENKRLPLMVHSRRAELDCIEMLESSTLKNEKIIMHCFMGRKHLVKRIISNGWSLSIPCIIGRLQQLQENVMMAPINQLLTETDAPYMSPFVETKRNESMFVAETLKKIAEIKKLDAEEVSKMVFANYQRIFL